MQLQETMPREPQSSLNSIFFMALIKTLILGAVAKKMKYMLL